MEFVKILVNCRFNYVVPNNLTRSPLPYFLKNFKWLVYGSSYSPNYLRGKSFLLFPGVRRRINNCSLFNNFNEVKFAFFSPKNYIVKVVRFFVSINTWCSFELFSLIPVLSLFR